MLFAILAYRFYVLIEFGFKYTDSDQTIIWLGTTEYAKGIFHEPFFYGQDYNLMIEALLALPLYWIGLPLKMALPIITTFLSFLPFLLLGILTIKNNKNVNAILILSTPCLLPIEYDLLTTIPRGFITGIALVSLIFPLTKFKPIDKFSGRDFMLLSLLSCIGYVATPNSILISLPLLSYALILNYNSKKFYLYSIIGIIIGGLFFFLLKSFYLYNPNYKLHTYFINLTIDNLTKGLKNLDDYFRMITPLFWKQGYLTLVFPILFSIYFAAKKNLWLAILSAIYPFALLLTMLISKVHDGNDSVFFHVSRMYLAVPLFLSWLFSNISFNRVKIIRWFVILPLSVLLYKSINLNKSIQSNLNKDHTVLVEKNSLLEKKCKNIVAFADEKDISLIIFLDHDMSQLLNTACPACEKGFPNTVYPKYERRTWRLIEDDLKIYKNILIFEKNRKLNQEFQFIKKSTRIENAYLIQNNIITTSKLYELLGIKVRYF